MIGDGASGVGSDSGGDSVGTSDSGSASQAGDRVHSAGRGCITNACRVAMDTTEGPRGGSEASNIYRQDRDLVSEEKK